MLQSLMWLLPGLCLAALAVLEVWRSSDEPESYARPVLVVAAALLALGATIAWLTRRLSRQPIPVPTTQPAAPRPASARRPVRWRFVLAANALALLLLVAVAEVGLRLVGFGPWRASDATMVDESGQRLWRPDDKLGFAHTAGRLQFELAPGGHWVTTQDERGHRRTSSAPHGDSRPALWICGCSFAFGWSVNDEETFAWKLQENLPDWHVVNLALAGGSTVQVLLSIDEQLAVEPPPKVVLYAYASFHDTRNTFSRDRQKAFAHESPGGIGLPPFAELNEAGRAVIVHKAPPYWPAPLTRWSATAHFCERAYDNLELRLIPHADVTAAVIEECRRRCAAVGSRFLVGGLTRDPATTAMLERCRAAGCESLWLAPAEKLPGMTNEPYDGHPSARAHTYFAERILEYLGNGTKS
jgi:hypothetical protein